MDLAVSLIDLHVHTYRKSIDSGLGPDALGRVSRDRGLTAICVTEHNAIWTPDDAHELSDKYELPVLRGMEISTDAGHVLTFGLTEYTAEMYSVEALRRIVLSEGGAMILAHPLRSPGFGMPWEEAPRLFEALESLNGDDRHVAAGLVASIAHALGMRLTGGSDAHSAQAVARCFTRFERHITTERELVEALHSDTYHPVEGHMDNAPPEPGEGVAHRLRGMPGHGQPVHHRG